MLAKLFRPLGPLLYYYTSNSSSLPGCEKLSDPNSFIFDLGFLISDISLVFFLTKVFSVCTEFVYYVVCVLTG